ncbi:hypothetical protein [Sphingosinicella soli]|uniref:Uncharacterized protein n=1 Tax=Sphingosinicella soli TaxID=333708 RepID=A0A7W7F6E8_9SPHN|nr:hypothetical protein [Sphingosinicella soli]MBB4632450.1 hypothetical protein [Sphingosinicella soli]
MNSGRRHPARRTSNMPETAPSTSTRREPGGLTRQQLRQIVYDLIG